MRKVLLIFNFGGCTLEHVSFSPCFTDVSITAEAQKFIVMIALLAILSYLICILHIIYLYYIMYPF